MDSATELELWNLPEHWLHRILNTYKKQPDKHSQSEAARVREELKTREEYKAKGFGSDGFKEVNGKWIKFI